MKLCLAVSVGIKNIVIFRIYFYDFLKYNRIFLQMSGLERYMRNYPLFSTLREMQGREELTDTLLITTDHKIAVHAGVLGNFKIFNKKEKLKKELK